MQNMYELINKEKLMSFHHRDQCIVRIGDIWSKTINTYYVQDCKAKMNAIQQKKAAKIILSKWQKINTRAKTK